MKLIFCIDKINGMLLFGKRQSMDKYLNGRLLEIVGNSKLWVSEYTSSLFNNFENTENIIIDDDYIAKAEAEDYCFVENLDYNLENVSEVLLCHWNRRYQADKFLDIDTIHSFFEKTASESMVGKSHEKITIETYRRK